MDQAFTLFTNYFSLVTDFKKDWYTEYFEYLQNYIFMTNCIPFPNKTDLIGKTVLL